MNLPLYQQQMKETLTQRCALLRRQTRPDGAGGQETEWRRVQSDVPCLVKAGKQRAETAGERQKRPAQTRIWLLAGNLVESGMRLDVEGDGLYAVVSAPSAGVVSVVVNVARVE